MSSTFCRGHQDPTSSDAPYFCREGCKYEGEYQDGYGMAEEPIEATNTMHPCIMYLPCELPGGLKLVAVTAPSRDTESAQVFLASLGQAIAEADGRQIGIVLRDGWDVGFIALSEDPACE